MTTPGLVSTGGPLVTTGGLFERVETFPIANCDIHWVSKPVGTTWKEYIPIADTASYEHVAIYFAGLPNAVNPAAMQVELIYNIELQSKPGDLLSALATNALSHNPTALGASAHSHSKSLTPVNASTSTVGGMIKRLALSGLKSVANYMLPVAGGMLGDFFGGGRRNHNMLRNIEEVD
jgi:hypothetical protein